MDGIYLSQPPVIAISAKSSSSQFLLIGFRSDTRQAIPAYNGLLFVYGILFIPVFFSLMVGLNILVWSKTRINYGFIFGAYHSSCVDTISYPLLEFDVKTQLDHREYFEVCDSPCCIYICLPYLNTPTDTCVATFNTLLRFLVVFPGRRTTSF